MAKKGAGRKEGKTARKSSAREGGGRRAAKASGGGEMSDYREARRRDKIEAPKKGGCMPKLGMFLLPFIAAGAYLLLRA